MYLFVCVGGVCVCVEEVYLFVYGGVSVRVLVGGWVGGWVGDCICLCMWGISVCVGGVYGGCICLCGWAGGWMYLFVYVGVYLFVCMCGWRDVCVCVGWVYMFVDRWVGGVCICLCV